MYKYGRGMWKSIENGNELSWVIGNGIGGYANHTVAGGGAQAFHGYLVASLNSPVNRKMILTRTQEEIIIGNNKYDLTSQQYIGTSKKWARIFRTIYFRYSSGILLSNRRCIYEKDYSSRI